MENAVVKAPYAEVAIPLFLGSSIGMRYRQLNCIECGHAFLERQGDVIYRLNDKERVSEINIIDGLNIVAVCGECTQKYTVATVINIRYDSNAIPLYMQPQSLYIVSEPQKRLRYIHCLECGHAFHSISDRIESMSDNRIPFEFVDPDRLGPVETMCHFNKCSQAWSLMV